MARHVFNVMRRPGNHGKQVLCPYAVLFGPEQIPKSGEWTTSRHPNACMHGGLVYNQAVASSRAGGIVLLMMITTATAITIIIRAKIIIPDSKLLVFVSFFIFICSLDWASVFASPQRSTLARGALDTQMVHSE